MKAKKSIASDFVKAEKSILRRHSKTLPLVVKDKKLEPPSTFGQHLSNSNQVVQLNCQ